MKYGLLYYKNTDNIGDDIQTYAQLRFLPKVDYLIDREKLGMFIPQKKELVSVIMNAWYMHNEIAWPPSPYINPLPISMHFTSNDRLKKNASCYLGLGAEYLKNISPIGGRDYETLNRLKKQKINCYFSGCMTLTIKPFDNIKKDNYICAVDIDNDILEKIKNSTDKKVVTFTHTVDPEKYGKLSIDTRMKKVEDILKKYQKASLVITSRLHVMLPCLAIGTPVIYVYPDNYEKDRIDSFLKYVKHVSKTDFLTKNISEILNNPIDNNSFIEIRNNLEKKCNDFIESKTINISSSLPEINEYKKIVELKEYYYDLYENCRKSSLNNILDADRYYKMLQDYLEKYENNRNNIDYLNNEIGVLTKTIDCIRSDLKKSDDKYELLKNDYLKLNSRYNKFMKFSLIGLLRRIYRLRYSFKANRGKSTQSK